MGQSKIKKSATAIAHGKNTSIRKKTNRNYHVALLIILLITFIAYLPVFHNGFVNLDDDKYLQDDPLIYSFNLKGIFSQYIAGNYHPFTILLYAVEYHFFGFSEKAYHSVNLAIHLLNVFLVFRVVTLLCKKEEVALVAALLFGIHPLHVESVAWASELKDLLYTFFFLASYSFYIQYLNNKRNKYFIFALLLFLFSLFSKAMAASLPALLLLTDFYKGRRFTAKVWLEKLPFFLLAIVFGVVAVFAQKSTSAIGDITAFPFYYRILFACFGFITYLQKLLLPTGLAVFYPYPIKGVETIPLYFYIYLILFIALAVAVFYSLRRTKIIAFGFGFFAITIFLVLQLLPVGIAIMADRYSYIPSIGIFYMIGEGVYILWHKKSLASSKIPVTIVLGAALLSFSVETYARCKVWKNSLSLLNDLINQYPNLYLAYNNRGLLYVEAKRYEEAMDDYNNAIRLEPNYALAHNDRGILYKELKRYDEALQDFNKAIEEDPDFYRAYTNKANTLIDQLKYDEALSNYDKAIEIEPNYVMTYYFRGYLYALQNKSAEALNDYQKVIELQPNYSEAYFNKGIIEHNMGKKDEACEDLQIAINLGWQPAVNAQRDLCH